MKKKKITTISVNEKNLKEAKEILEELGMNFSQAVGIFLAMIIKHQGLPFEVRFKKSSYKRRKELDEFKKRLNQPFGEFSEEDIPPEWR